MSGPLPMKESSFQRLITVLLLFFVISLGIGLAQAHCEEVAAPAALYLSLSAADLGTTAMALHTPGVSEGNAFMRGHRIEKQLALAGLLTLVDVKLQKRGHAKALRVAVTVIRVAAITINLHNAGRQR